MKSGRILFTATAVGVMALGACTNPDGSTNRTQDGVAIGAALGGLFGATAGKGDTLGQAAAGALVGGAIGGLIGADLDRQAAELDRDLGNGVGVVNTGNQLIVTMPQDVLFATDSTALRPDLRSDLNTLAASLLRYPNTRIEVIGHTDNVGSASYNQNLSEGRAKSVASVLIGAGVPSGRIIAYGRGEDQPIASNLDAAGRAKNRRVEIIIRPNT
ncbi:OmpA family protein [Phaeovulum sp.]|uniref:OmpA family protein n=1 Tax=Phaeovulum sp. TaxID=2934796 RepID=UPI0035667B50